MPPISTRCDSGKAEEPPTRIPHDETVSKPKMEDALLTALIREKRLSKRAIAVKIRRSVAATHARATYLGLMDPARSRTRSEADSG